MGISYLGKNKTEPTSAEPKDNGAEMATYFEQQVITLGIKDVGQPIEGFDADLVRLAFPGFVIADFENVETLSGYYKVNGDKLEYIRGASQPISEAERTISSAGYATLLQNTSARLSFSTTSKESIDSLIQAVNLAEKISARIGETVSALGIIVTPVEIIEDSRCPSDVNCFQAGTVKLKTNLATLGYTEAERIFTLNIPITTNLAIVTLVAVEPEANSKVKIKDADYIFHFEIQILPKETIELPAGSMILSE